MKRSSTGAHQRPGAYFRYNKAMCNTTLHTHMRRIHVGHDIIVHFVGALWWLTVVEVEDVAKCELTCIWSNKNGESAEKIG